MTHEIEATLQLRQNLGQAALGKWEEEVPEPGRWEECCPLTEEPLSEMGLPSRVRILKLHIIHPVARPANWGHGKN